MRSVATFLVIGIIAAFSGVAYADPPTLTSLRVEPIAIGKNLIPNPSFDSNTPRGLPVGWNWSARNTNATLRSVSDAHSGPHALCLTNGSNFGADVYGMLWRRDSIALEPGRHYVLSAWTKSQDPGIAWIGGGKDWQYRLHFPATEGKWRRVWLTFVAAPEDHEFVLRCCTESPTSGVLLDDIKLEEGDEPTPDVPEEPSSASVSLTPVNIRAEIEGDGPFEAASILYTPAPITLKAEAQLAGSPALHSDLKLEPGAWRILVSGKSTAADDAPRRLLVRVTPTSGKPIESEQTVVIYSASGGLKRIAALQRVLPELRKLLDKAKSGGQDISYPLISYTVLENFTRYAAEDIRKGQVRRGLMQLADLEPMALRCRNQLRASGALPRVPRWNSDYRPRVEHSSFLAPVRIGKADSVPSPRSEGKGSQWITVPVFFTGYGAFGQVRDDIEKFPAYGVNIIQIEVGPSALFPREGVVDEAPIKEMQRILVRAQRAGVAVNLLISPHYFPDWMLEKYPYLRKHREGFLQYCLHAPESKALLQRFVSTLLPPLKNYPALHSICLSNEPVNVEEPCEFATQEWRAYLRTQHGTIQALNDAWRTSYADFDAVPLPDPFQSPPIGPIGMDYVLYNRQFFAGWHRMLADAVHAVAPDLPVHAKAMTWTMVSGQDVRYGVDAELFGAFSNINGNDSANMYAYEPGEFAQEWELNALDHDLQRSVRDAPVFNSENHIIPDRETRYVPAQHVYTAIWQAAIHGQSATTIWVWERSFDPKSDAYGSIMHRPACAEAVGKVNCDLNRTAREVTALQQAEPDVAILQSVTGAVWEAGPYTDSLNKLYTAITFHGLKAGFVTENQLQNAVFPQAKVLFVPSIVHLSRSAVAGLQQYASLPGKRLVLLGGEGNITRDEYDRRLPSVLSAERLAFSYGKSGWRDLYVQLAPLLPKWGVVPKLGLVDGSGQPVTGIEWRCAETSRGLIVDLVNYRKTSQRVRLVRPGGKLHGVDLLTEQRVDGLFTLSPLETRLLRVASE